MYVKLNVIFNLNN